MPLPAITIILQLAVQYGIPLAREVVALFQKKEVTIDDWNKIFDLAETPYGLTADTTSIAAWSEKLSVAAAPPPASAMADAPTAKNIKSVKLTPDGGWLVCYTDGTCYFVPAPKS
jgi:hypothetical protein